MFAENTELAKSSSKLPRLQCFLFQYTDCSRLQRYLITIRNKAVSRGLQQKYVKDPAAGSLQIFCVSNKMYEEKRHGLAAEAKPYLQLSGIIELRRHCMGISAESHLRQTKEYINHRIPAFVASLELWAQTKLGNTSEERNQQVLQVVSAAQKYIKKVREVFQRNLLFVTFLFVIKVLDRGLSINLGWHY